MTPSVSLILATDRAELISQTVSALREQAVWPQLELVVVHPRASAVELEPELLAGVGSVQYVQAEPFLPLSRPRAAGVRAARAPIVYIGETHSFLGPGSLDVLLERIEAEDYAAVLPAFACANPRRAASWANLLVTYRDLLEPERSRALVEIPTYNACVRRELLIAYGEQLPAMLQYGNGLGPDLIRRGHRLWLEADAQLFHQNVATLHATVVDRFLGARAWGATRSREWPAARRLLYALGSPLIPPLTLARVLRSPQWARLRTRLPRGTPAWLAFACCWIALGEGLGYLLGPGAASEQIARWELDRRSHV